ncbi:MAG TPA: M23 family metallopeptidase [Candidatus Scybalousia intestinigallinarum]|nr:M23 family metallopeptidase [Candidatus Scybalousia intestinigallinarum]
MEEYKSVGKYLHKVNKTKNVNIWRNLILSFLNKSLISGLLLISTLCMIKMYPDTKEFIEKRVYQDNISFAAINNFYEKYFGDIFPMDSILKDNTRMVFNEQLVFHDQEKYLDGVKLTVDKGYLVPVLDSGIVVFIGDKEKYGPTIIIQQVNGVDVWYVGVDSSSIKLYDYVEKGDLLGEALETEICLVYQKAGEFLDYQEYLP